MDDQDLMADAWAAALGEQADSEVKPAKLGRTHDKVAVRIVEKIKRPDSVKNELTLVTRGGMRIDGVAELEELEKSIEEEE